MLGLSLPNIPSWFIYLDLGKIANLHWEYNLPELLKEYNLENDRGTDDTATEFIVQKSERPYPRKLGSLSTIGHSATSM